MEIPVRFFAGLFPLARTTLCDKEATVFNFPTDNKFSITCLLLLLSFYNIYTGYVTTLQSILFYLQSYFTII